jgi:maleate isomerase
MTEENPIVFRAGMMVPSSNTVVEDAWAGFAPSMPGTRCHFARVSVTAITQDAESLSQFEQDRMVAAASLLAELNPDQIVWAGTSAGWLGFERDVHICQLIEANTGIAATSSLLAVNKALGDLDAQSIGLVTPYDAATEAAIVANYEAAGITVAARERLDLTVNTDYAAVPPSLLLDMSKKVARSDAEAIVILCTNLMGASIADEAAKATGIPVIDSVQATFQSFGNKAGKP